MGGMMGGATGSRPSDLDVEIRGTITLIAKPVPEVIGLTEADLPPPENEQPADGQQLDGPIPPAADRSRREEETPEGGES